ncbi:hypothetical protein ABZ004_30515, partial [Kribbella sp. NPDC006257]
PGQTSTDNLTPLGRLSHRIKTHGGWNVTRLDDDTLEWTTRYGFTLHVTHRGTYLIHNNTEPLIHNNTEPLIHNNTQSEQPQQPEFERMDPLVRTQPGLPEPERTQPEKDVEGADRVRVETELQPVGAAGHIGRDGDTPTQDEAHRPGPGAAAPDEQARPEVASGKQVPGG